MPAKSKKQQKFMGMVHAAQKGEKPASARVAKVAKSINKANDFKSSRYSLPRLKNNFKTRQNNNQFKSDKQVSFKEKKNKNSYKLTSQDALNKLRKTKAQSKLGEFSEVRQKDFLKNNKDKIVFEDLFTNTFFTSALIKDTGVDKKFYNILSTRSRLGRWRNSRSSR